MPVENTSNATAFLILDYHTSERISGRYTEPASHSIQLHVWSRKEIENYLLVPSVIHRAICEGVAADVTPPTLEEVEQAMNRFIDELRDEVMDALSTELLSQDKAGGVANANRLAREVITEAWATADGRLSAPLNEATSRVAVTTRRH